MEAILYSSARNNRDRLLEAVEQIDNLKFTKKDIDI
jgi:hypothetical protein